MNKILISSGVFLLAFALCLSSVLAVAQPSCNGLLDDDNCCGITGMTTIKGVIYEGNESNGIKKANVEVTCHHEGNDYTRNAVSWHNGKYIAFFKLSECEYGDSLTVSAEKDGLTGTNSGTVDFSSTTGCFTLDVGVVNVPLIPEFGMIVGTLTVISAIGVFFLVRKN